MTFVCPLGAIKRTGAHQHVWSKGADPEHFPELDKGVEVLHHAHSPDKLRPLVAKAGVGGTSTPHGQKYHYEMVFRPDHAACHLFIRGVVCWFDLSDPEFA